MTNQTRNEDKSTITDEAQAGPTSFLAKLERFVSAGRGLLIILGAIIAALVWSFDHLNSRINQNINNTVSEIIGNQLKNPEEPLGKLYECVKSIDTKVGFGEWDNIRANRTYQAKSDGFLIAFSSGSGKVAKFTLETGKPEQKESVRTRAARYDGAVTPVKKGDFYKIHVEEDRNPLTITAHWLPIVHESTHHEVCSKI